MHLVDEPGTRLKQGHQVRGGSSSAGGVGLLPRGA